MGLILPAVLVVVLDQLTKQLLWRNAHNYEIIGGYLNITLVRNSGAAFGMFQGGRLFFVIASVAAIILITWVGWRLPRADRYRRLLLGVILGGAVGNLIDRLIHGNVIDFLQIGVAGHYWPVFNVADMAVTIGAVLLVLHAMRTPHPLSKTAPDGAGGAGDQVDDPSAR